MTARDRQARQALRIARRLGESFKPEEYRRAWAIVAQIRKSRQRRESWRGGAFSYAGGAYRAQYLADMATARREGKIHLWQGHRQGLDIWRGSAGAWLPQ